MCSVRGYVSIWSDLYCRATAYQPRHCRERLRRGRSRGGRGERRESLAMDRGMEDVRPPSQLENMTASDIYPQCDAIQADLVSNSVSQIINSEQYRAIQNSIERYHRGIL